MYKRQGYECVIEDGVNNPEIEVNNYYKANKVLLACNDSGELVEHGQQHSGEIPSQNWTKFYLPEDASTSTANIVIREDSC